ncbi:MAG: recombinase RecT, partial [Alphaproteobacteria bacterium]
MAKKATKKFSTDQALARQETDTAAVARMPVQSGRATVQALFERSSGELSKALAGQMQTDRFIRAAMTAYSNGSSYFQKAEPVSLLAACMQAAQLGLSVDPVLGEAWLIPRRNGQRNCVWVNFQLGYKGLIKLARRSDNFLSVHAELVHEGDFFQYDLGSDPKITHRKQMKVKARPEVIAAYAVVRYKTGPAQIHVSP